MVTISLPKLPGWPDLPDLPDLPESMVRIDEKFCQSVIYAPFLAKGQCKNKARYVVKLGGHLSVSTGPFCKLHAKKLASYSSKIITIDEWKAEMVIES